MSDNPEELRRKEAELQRTQLLNQRATAVAAVAQQRKTRPTKIVVVDDEDRFIGRVGMAILNKLPRPTRIVVVDDEDWFLDMVEMAILSTFQGVTVQKIQDSEKAWQELLRADPDLLITGVVMPGIDGVEIIRRLVERKAAYPILLVSEYPPAEQWVREYTDKNSNITFLRKPFTVEQLYAELAKHL